MIIFVADFWVLEIPHNLPKVKIDSMVCAMIQYETEENIRKR